VLNAFWMNVFILASIHFIIESIQDQLYVY
jgi:hypothetical protein